MNEEEKKAIKLLEDIKNNSWTTKYIMSSDSKNADILLNLITKLQKYDYRNIKIDEENKIKSPSFTAEQLGLMNLGIALYIGIPKLLEDEEGEIEV